MERRETMVDQYPQMSQKNDPQELEHERQEDRRDEKQDRREDQRD